MNDSGILLIIDDDAGDQKLMEESLVSAGIKYSIEFAKNAEEGIAKSNELKPEIVILDTMLPDMDGFTACQRIKAIDENIRIVICTGVVDAVDAGRARNAGANDYCVKTSDFEALLNAIQNVSTN